mmetsp:Transcript_6277/g.9744  ORF Transcript_6277/g.9744 Transcript_6277/m.9744 type:complete len:349 (+) Transcript_6277:270-1316(+)
MHKSDSFSDLFLAGARTVKAEPSEVTDDLSSEANHLLQHNHSQPLPQQLEIDNETKILEVRNHIEQLDDASKRCIMDCLFRLAATATSNSASSTCSAEGSNPPSPASLDYPVSSPKSACKFASSLPPLTIPSASPNSSVEDVGLCPELDLSTRQEDVLVLRMMFLPDAQQSPVVMSPSPGGSCASEMQSQMASVGIMSPSPLDCTFLSSSPTINQPRSSASRPSMLTAPSTPSSKSDGGSTARKRVFFTEEQTRKLNAYYAELGGAKCSPAEISQIGKDVGITEHQVRIYFQNKRARTRNRKTDDSDDSTKGSRRSAGSSRFPTSLAVAATQSVSTPLLLKVEPLVAI